MDGWIDRFTDGLNNCEVAAMTYTAISFVFGGRTREEKIICLGAWSD